MIFIDVLVVINFGDRYPAYCDSCGSYYHSITDYSFIFLNINFIVLNSIFGAEMVD